CGLCALVAKRDPLNARSLKCERTHKSAALAVDCPRDVESSSDKLIELRHRGHRVSHLSKRLIEDVLVAAQLVLSADRASLYSGDVTGPHHRRGVVPTSAADFYLDRRDLDPHDVLQKLTGH